MAVLNREAYLSFIKNLDAQQRASFTQTIYQLGEWFAGKRPIDPAPLSHLMHLISTSWSKPIYPSKLYRLTGTFKVPVKSVCTYTAPGLSSWTTSKAFARNGYNLYSNRKKAGFKVSVILEYTPTPEQILWTPKGLAVTRELRSLPVSSKINAAWAKAFDEMVGVYYEREVILLLRKPIQVKIIEVINDL